MAQKTCNTASLCKPVVTKTNCEWVQRLTIHYNCIGSLFVPDIEPPPVSNVTMNTRCGVYVTYEPAQNE